MSYTIQLNQPGTDPTFTKTETATNTHVVPMSHIQQEIDRINAEITQLNDRLTQKQNELAAMQQAETSLVAITVTN